MTSTATPAAASAAATAELFDDDSVYLDAVYRAQLLALERALESELNPQPATGPAPAPVPEAKPDEPALRLTDAVVTEQAELGEIEKTVHIKDSGACVPIPDPEGPRGAGAVARKILDSGADATPPKKGRKTRNRKRKGPQSVSVEDVSAVDCVCDPRFGRRRAWETGLRA